MKNNRKPPVLMLLAIVLMALISMHGCGLDDPADADLLLEEIVPLINKFKIEDDQLFLFYPENNYLLFHRTIKEP